MSSTSSAPNGVPPTAAAPAAPAARARIPTAPQPNILTDCLTWLADRRFSFTLDAHAVARLLLAPSPAHAAFASAYLGPRAPPLNINSTDSSEGEAPEILPFYQPPLPVTYPTLRGQGRGRVPLSSGPPGPAANAPRHCAPSSPIQVPLGDCEACSSEARFRAWLATTETRGACTCPRRTVAARSVAAPRIPAPTFEAPRADPDAALPSSRASVCCEDPMTLYATGYIAAMSATPEEQQLYLDRLAAAADSNESSLAPYLAARPAAADALPLLASRRSRSASSSPRLFLATAPDSSTDPEAAGLRTATASSRKRPTAAQPHAACKRARASRVWLLAFSSALSATWLILTEQAL